jgi:4-aminobutyrate aminotransferase-like enzyme
MLALLDVELARLSHPAAERTHPWDLSAASRHRPSVARVPDPGCRRDLECAFHLWAACAAPRLPDLPSSIIHGDANDENLMVANDHIVGLLDFGDCLLNPTVSDLAIALVYAMLELDDPLEAGALVVGAYDDVRPLETAELDVLFPLICGRLAASVAVAAERRHEDPDRSEWFVTEERAWRLLRALVGFEPAEARAVLAASTGAAVERDAGAAPRELLEKRKVHIGSSLSIAYAEPLKMVRGEGQYLHASSGRPYLDLVNNVCHVGHCHPRVVEAGQRQMARLNTNTRYLYDGLTEYAERLTATLPEPLRVCFFVNSGSEANELALRLARTHTGRRDVVVLEGAYHGHTGNLIAISPYKFEGRGGTGVPEPWVHVAPMPDGYRGRHRGTDRTTGEAYGEEVGRVISEAAAPTGAFITESLLSCAGQIVPPEGFLETAFRYVRDAGGLCIVDEVQVGFGRPGACFWGFELQNVVPDVVVMGKPIGNGHPLSAVVTTADVARSFDNGMEFFSTFGGNPVSCAIGLAVLDVVEEEGLQANALRIGGRLLAGLRQLEADHPLIGDVRGTGLFIGVELVRNRNTLEPAAEQAAEIVERMKGRGMLLSTDGPLHNVLKIKPPMVITAADVDMVVRSLGDELSALEALT